MTEHTQAVKDVLAERQRQVDVEGWTPEHDAKHDDFQLAAAAICYIEAAVEADGDKLLPVPWKWPWEKSWWKPKSRRRNLVRAGALILAEIERLDRAEQDSGRE